MKERILEIFGLSSDTKPFFHIRKYEEGYDVFCYKLGKTGEKQEENSYLIIAVGPFLDRLSDLYKEYGDTAYLSYTKSRNPIEDFEKITKTIEEEYIRLMKKDLQINQ